MAAGWELTLPVKAMQAGSRDLLHITSAVDAASASLVEGLLERVIELEGGPPANSINTPDPTPAPSPTPAPATTPAPLAAASGSKYKACADMTPLWKSKQNRAIDFVIYLVILIIVSNQASTEEQQQNK